MVGQTRSARAAARYADAQDYHGGTWLFGHLMVGLALLDAFLFRNLLMRDLVASEAGLLTQVQRLTLWAAAIAFPLLILYAMTKRTARARANLYHLGAWIFFGVTVYLLYEDYLQHAEPGTFSTRINLAITRIERFTGLDLPQLE